MESLKNLLCCSKPTKTPIPQISNRYSMMRSVSVIDGSQANPFQDLDSCSSDEVDDEADVADDRSHVETEVGDPIPITTRARFAYDLEGWRAWRGNILDYDPPLCGARKKHSNSQANPFEGMDSISSDERDDETEDFVVDENHPEAEVDDRGPITTRARFKYDLEGYSKNVMIIFAQSQESKEERRPVHRRIKLLKQHFEEFRFEVEEHVDLSKEEVEAKLDEFFSKDFTAYGAVCVVVLSTRTEAGLLAARAQRYHESVVLRWLTEDQPTSLRGKPKIYITEAERYGDAAQTGVYTLPINRYYHDVVGIHIPVVIDDDDKSHPLELLCSHLGKQAHFLEDVYSAVHEAETTFSKLQEQPIQVTSTLQLELRLERKKIASIEMRN